MEYKHLLRENIQQFRAQARDNFGYRQRDLADVVTLVRNLLYCLDLELLWIAYTTHIKYLLFA